MAVRGRLLALLVSALLAAPVAAASSAVPGVDAGRPAGAPTAASTCAADGVLVLHPGQDVRRRVSAAGPGRTICFGPGTYRLTSPILPRAGQTLVGDDATLSGARVLRGFVRADDGWVVGGQRQQGERHGECRRGRACRYPDDVVRDGRPLTRVLARDDLRRGTYFFDYPRNRIVVADDPRGHRLEALVARAAITSRTGDDGAAGADVTVRDLVVEHVASLAQRGAVSTSAPGWTIERTTVRDNHGAGITTEGHARVLHNRVLRNGQLGIGGNGDDTLVRGNLIAHNGGGGFDAAWEAGGAKWALTTDLVVTHNRVLDNEGPGLWTDIDAVDTTYAHNLVRGNADAGIFHEISGAATIRDNTVVGNGHGFDTWLWGSGILLAGSHDVTVSGNRLRGNAQGIGLIQQHRGRSERDGSRRTLHDVVLRDNVTTMRGRWSGGVTDSGYDQMFTDPTITWSDNTWLEVGDHPFAWDGKELSAAQWRALGHDVDGTFTP